MILGYSEKLVSSSTNIASYFKYGNPRKANQPVREINTGPIGGGTCDYNKIRLFRALI